MKGVGFLRIISPVLAFLCLPVLLSARVINVPGDFVSIKSAVAAAQDGDHIEIEDGTYYEESILVDHAIHIRARHPYGAVISGSYEKNVQFPFFIVRAAAEFEGLIFRNGYDGIVQRNSPDVLWSAHDLIFEDMIQSGISINAVDGTIGRVKARRIAFNNLRAAFTTNDANSLDARGCFIANCRFACTGNDHLRYYLDRVFIWNCRDLVLAQVNASSTRPPATDRIEFGPRTLRRNPADFKTRPQAVLDEARDFLAEESGFPKAFLLEYLANGALRSGCLVEADFLFQAALKAGPGQASNGTAWRAHRGLGLVREAQGRLTEARAHLRRAVDGILKSQSGISRDLFQNVYFKGHAGIFEAYLRVLQKLSPGGFLTPLAEEAFRIAEYPKVGAARIDPRILSTTPDGSGTASEERRLEADISRAQVRIQKAGDSAESDSRLWRELDSAEQAHLDHLVRRAMASGLSSPAGRPAELGLLRQKLRRDHAALIEYSLGPEQAWAMIVTPTELVISRLDPHQKIADAVSYYLRFLTLRAGGEFAGWTGGRLLFDALLGRLADRIPADTRRLIIVPDGELWTLPFEALVCPREKGQSPPPGGDDRFGFLIERWAVTYAVSASSYARSPERSNSKWAMDYLGLAKTRDFPRPILQGGLGGYGVVFRFADFPTPAGPMGSRVPELPWTEEEIDGAGRRFAPARKILLRERDVSEAVFKRLDLGRYRIIHLATHGVIDDLAWRRSAILLGGDGIQEDGLLQPREIAGLNLSADLVVLSSCRSGAGSRAGGLGPSELTVSFLEAGARRVLASLWPVSDRSTAGLMDSFYGSLEKESEFGQVLRLAKLQMLRSAYRHPFHWASFVLVGG